MLKIFLKELVHFIKQMIIKLIPCFMNFNWVATIRCIWRSSPGASIAISMFNSLLGYGKSPNPKGFHIATMHQKPPPKGFLVFMCFFQVFLLLAKPFHMLGYLTFLSLSLIPILKHTSQFSLCSTITENKTRIAKNGNSHLVVFSHFIGKKTRTKQVNFPRIVQLVEGKSGESPRTRAPSHRLPAVLPVFSSFPGAVLSSSNFPSWGPLPAHYGSL